VRIAISCAALALLAGCSVVPSEALTFDPARLSGKTTLLAPELSALTDRVAELQLQRNEIRARIAGQSDIWERQHLYGQLHGIGMQLSPLERRLATLAAAR
jgi:hypothetical protein